MSITFLQVTTLTKLEVDVAEDSLNNLLDYYEFPGASSLPRVIQPATANQFMNVFCKLLDPKRNDVMGKFSLATT